MRLWTRSPHSCSCKLPATIAQSARCIFPKLWIWWTVLTTCPTHPGPTVSRHQNLPWPWMVPQPSQWSDSCDSRSGFSERNDTWWVLPVLPRTSKICREHLSCPYSVSFLSIDLPRRLHVAQMDKREVELGILPCQNFPDRSHQPIRPIANARKSPFPWVEECPYSSTNSWHHFVTTDVKFYELCRHQTSNSCLKTNIFSLISD